MFCILCQKVPFPGAPITNETRELLQYIRARRSPEISTSDSQTPSGAEPRSEDFVGKLQVCGHLAHTVYLYKPNGYT